MSHTVRILSTEIYDSGTSRGHVSHEVSLDWKKTDLLCMDCASKAVFEALNSERDYGGGNRHVCAMCGFEFYGHIGNDYSAHTDTTAKLRALMENT